MNQGKNRPKGLQELVYIMLSIAITFTGLRLVVERLYEKPMTYSEIMVGLTTFWGYPKQADLQVFQIALVGVVVLYFVTKGLHKTAVKIISVNKETDKNTASQTDNTSSSFANNTQFTWKLWQVIELFICTFYGMCGLYTLISFVIKQPFGGKTGFILCIALGELIACGICIVNMRKKIDVGIKYMTKVTQLFIPLCMLGFVRFAYQYGNEEVTLFSSRKWKLFCLCLLMLGLFICLYRIWKKREGIALSSITIIAMECVYKLPQPRMNIDFFHNGEITVPMQQLLHYGKLPYIDLVPIHGFCDYSYGLLDTLFFDGSFLALNAASVVMNLCMAAFFAILFYVVCENRAFATCLTIFFVPFMTQAGMRYMMLFAMCFLLFSKHAWKDSAHFVWWYGLLCIVAIAWNPSIGGSGALAFFPIALYHLVKVVPVVFHTLTGKKEKEYLSKQMLILYGVLFALGIAFIPLFLQIVLYLKENTGTTLVANGMEMIENLSRLSDYFVPNVSEGTAEFLIKTFACLLPLLALMGAGSLLNEQSQKKRTWALALSLFIGLYVIANYAFVRYDDGLRTRVVGTFFLLLVGVYFVEFVWRQTKQMGFLVSGAFLLVASLYVSDVPCKLIAELPLAKGEVEQSEQITIMGKEVEDPIVYVDGASVGIANLGSGFISGDSLQSLKNIAYVLDTALAGENSYLDLTNAVANYVVFDKASDVKYTSGYNICNELMQQTAIAALVQNPPKLVLIAPYIKFDDATISLRSSLLYRYLLENDYKPYRYNNVIYMAREQLVPEATEDFEAFAGLMHKEVLQFLPGVLGESGVAEQLSFQDSMQPLFEEGVHGRSVSYIRVILEEKEKAKAPFERVKKVEALRKGNNIGEAETKDVELSAVDHIVLTFDSEIAGENRTISMNAYLYGDDYLFPVCSSPYWTEGFIKNVQVTSSTNDVTIKEMQYAP